MLTDDLLYLIDTERNHFGLGSPNWKMLSVVSCSPDSMLQIFLFAPSQMHHETMTPLVSI